jgi:hypothetical protein
MMIVFVICASIGVISCIVFGALCVRPALRIRALVHPSAGRPLSSVSTEANASFATLSAAAVEFESANRRFGAAAASMDAAFASIGAYVRQVAIIAVVVDSILELVVPRLRGMME